MKESDVDVVVGGKVRGKNLANSSFNIHSITELSLTLLLLQKKKFFFSSAICIKQQQAGSVIKESIFTRTWDITTIKMHIIKNVSPRFSYIFFREE